MRWTVERVGIAYVILHVLLWGLFPVFAKSTFASISPLWSMAIGALAASLFFACIVSVQRKWFTLPHALRSIGVWSNTFFNGILFYVCFYVGLRSTTAGNASIVALFEVLTTIIILGSVRKSERMTMMRIVGALLILFGVLVILLRNATIPHGGELLILLATFFVPLGNLAGKDALLKISSVMILLVRSVVSGIVLCLIAWLVEGLPAWENVLKVLPTVLFMGFFLLGFAKVFWMESMSRIQIAQGVSLGSLSPIVTIVVGALVLDESIHLYHLLSLIPVLIGIHLIVRQPRLLRQAAMEL